MNPATPVMRISEIFRGIGGLRANPVRAYLLTKGIDPLRVTSKGYGMTVPVADNKTVEGRAQNRRTEVKILD